MWQGIWQGVWQGKWQTMYQGKLKGINIPWERGNKCANEHENVLYFVELKGMESTSCGTLPSTATTTFSNEREINAKAKSFSDNFSFVSAMMKLSKVYARPIRLQNVKKKRIKEKNEKKNDKWILNQYPFNTTRVCTKYSIESILMWL